MLSYDYPLGGFFWSMLIFFIWIIWFMLLFQVFIDIFRSRDLSGWGKALWFLFVLFIPIIGVVVYLIARGRTMGERQLAAMQTAQKQTDQYIKSVASSASPADQIASAKGLLDSGAITQAEFDQLKAKALA